MTESSAVRPASARLATLPLLRRTVRITAVALLGVTAAYHLQTRIPDIGEIGAVLRQTHMGWLIAAGIAMFTSIDMFARHQRSLVRAVGVTLPHHRALALATSRSAMAYSLPAGSAVSAAYAYRQFHSHGVDHRSSATLIALSGTLLISALVVLYSAGMLVAAVLDLGATHIVPPAVLAAATAALGIILLLIVRSSSRPFPLRYYTIALAAAIANWTGELLCLVFVTKALGLPVGIFSLAAIFLGAQIARQFPLTPGGVGIVEATLLAGLISAGAPTASAAASVLVYRLFSCWLILPIGFAGWIFLRKNTARPATQRPRHAHPD